MPSKKKTVPKFRRVMVTLEIETAVTLQALRDADRWDYAFGVEFTDAVIVPYRVLQAQANVIKREKANVSTR